MLGTLETTFHGQTTFRLAGGSLNWSETNGAKVASEHRNVKKKKFSNTFIPGTKWLRHKKWVLNWSFLRELNSKPIFEQVTPSWSPGKKGKSLGADEVQKVPGLIGLNCITARRRNWTHTTRFQLILPVDSQNVTKNRTGHRMHVEGLQIDQINLWNNSYQNMYGML